MTPVIAATTTLSLAGASQASRFCGRVFTTIDNTAGPLSVCSESSMLIFKKKFHNPKLRNFFSVKNQ
jgi:hypothetical protein